MEKKIKDAIEKLIHLRMSIAEEGNISPANLLKESGYLEFSGQINEEEIEEILKVYPHLVGEWLLWSENKRTSDPVWRFFKFDEGSYLVGGQIMKKLILKMDSMLVQLSIKREAEDLREFV